VTPPEPGDLERELGMLLLDFFKTGPDKPILDDQEALKQLYEWKRKTVFFGLVFGYSFYYVCRLTLSIARKPMVDEGILNPEQLGTIGFAFFLAYAFGKLINGFLADRSNIGRLMSTGLRWVPRPAARPFHSGSATRSAVRATASGARPIPSAKASAWRLPP